MNNSIRSLFQEKYETALLKKMSKTMPREDVLEIGCGQGAGRKIIQKHFAPRSYIGIDLDPKMIQRAKNTYPVVANEFKIGDAASLEFADNSFGAIFDYGIVHHIPNWRDALHEVYRVLKPGKEFIFEDLSIDTWNSGIGKILRHVLDHPYNEMFTENEFKNGLQDVGFTIDAFESKTMMYLKFFVGVAKKPLHSL